MTGSSQKNKMDIIKADKNSFEDVNELKEVTTRYIKDAPGENFLPGAFSMFGKGVTKSL